MLLLCATVLAMLWPAPSIRSDSLGGIQASADTTHLTVGDPFWYTVILRLPADSRPSLPGIDAELDGFEVRDYYEETMPLPDGYQQVLLRYQLVTFSVGDTQIADFQIQAERTVDGKPHTDKYLAPPVKITVESVLPAEGAEPKPIYGPVFLAPRWYSWLKPLGIVLALAAIVLVGRWLWHKRRRANAMAAEIVLTPHEAACHALKSLGDRNLIDTGQMKLFYSELGDIMRRWLEYRAHIRAMELTTGLIRHDLRVTDLASDWQDQFIALLQRADLVKFAKWSPGDGVAYDDLELAYLLLEREAPAEPDTEAAQGGQPDEGEAA
jgi:hypothetical protein